MRILAPVLALLVGLACGAALGGRQISDQERAQLVTALQAQECSGGKVRFDDGKFEVDDARCADGSKYDLDFDRSFKLIKKDRDN